MARIRANDPATRAHWRGLADEFSESGWYHSIELPGGEVLQGLQTLDQQKERLRLLPIPDDLSGKRVLDIGTWDGWFAFEMERPQRRRHRHRQYRAAGLLSRSRSPRR